MSVLLRCWGLANYILLGLFRDVDGRAALLGVLAGKAGDGSQQLGIAASDSHAVFFAQREPVHAPETFITFACDPALPA